jgi:hypothetical protein
MIYFDLLRYHRDIILILLQCYCIFVGGVTVSKYSTANDGAMFLVKFVSGSGDVPLLIMNDSLLAATVLNTAVDTYQDGATIGGSFIVASNIDMAEKDIGYSSALPYDASESAMAAALERLNSSFIPVIVKRTDGDVNGTYIWMVTFPFSAGNLSKTLNLTLNLTLTLTISVSFNTQSFLLTSYRNSIYKLNFLSLTLAQTLLFLSNVLKILAIPLTSKVNPSLYSLD